MTINAKDLLACIQKTSNDKCVSIAKHEGKDVLHVKFPKGSAAPHGDIKGGFVAYHPCSGFPAQSATISFSVYFDNSFQWNKGGKLPWGFYMGDRGASGGRHTESGGTVRLMWRRDGAAEAYLYFPKDTKQSDELDKEPGVVKDASFGMSLWRSSFTFAKGKYNKISMRLGLNDPGKQNGSLSLTINGKSQTFDKFMWRKDGNMQITGLMGAAFFGGNDKTWASPVDTFMNITDIDCKTDVDQK